MRVELLPDAIKISHRRWEQTQDYDATNFFKFQWSVTLTFDRRMTALQVYRPAPLPCTAAAPRLRSLCTAALHLCAAASDRRSARLRLWAGHHARAQEGGLRGAEAVARAGRPVQAPLAQRGLWCDGGFRHQGVLGV